MREFRRPKVLNAVLLVALVCAAGSLGPRARQDSALIERASAAPRIHAGSAPAPAHAKTIAADAPTLADAAMLSDAAALTAAPTPAVAATPDAAPTPEISNSIALRLPLARPRILVLKARRQLILFDGDRAVRLYRVGLGTSPVGDKVREGDRRTPEGDYYVCVKNAHSNFLVSLGLSYPNREDAGRGLRDGLITRAQYAQIVRAIKRKRTPSWKTALGGEIFIHGRGAQSDWTWGCIALDDAEMRELFDAVPLGAPVTIEA